jgi:hypothetical protein
VASIDAQTGGPAVGAGTYGASGPVLLNRRSRIRKSLNRSQAASCVDFACGVRESGVILRDPRKQVPKLAETDRAFPLTTLMKQKAY